MTKTALQGCMNLRLDPLDCLLTQPCIQKMIRGFCHLAIGQVRPIRSFTPPRPNLTDLFRSRAGGRLCRYALCDQA